MPHGAPVTGSPEAPARAPAPLAPEFLHLLIAGRWVVLATVVLSILLPIGLLANREALVVLGIITAIYNSGLSALLRAGRVQGLHPANVIGIDLLLVTLLDWFSGGVQSPFLGLYYVIIIVAAAIGDLKGGLLTATAVTIVEALMALLQPRVSGIDWTFHLSFAVSTVPYLFLAALASGYLVRRLREQWQRLEETEARLALVQRDLEIAREVQGALTHTAPLNVPGFELGAFTHTQYGIGGDLQDYVPIPEGIGVALADVVGHGLSAALLAARLAHLLDELGLGTPLPEVLESWNRTIFERTPAEMYVTMAIVELRAADGRGRYTVAGHPPPLHWRSATGDIRPLQVTGTALGVLPEPRIQVCEMVLDPSDVLLIYTDGAVEARDDEGELLGIDGLSRLLAQHSSLPPREMVNQIAADIIDRCDMRDDMTLIAVKRRHQESRAGALAQG
ncbi:MAG TPA: SpoIIE family protein phosphatase [Armatimonadetes bacterium]|nr:SpoIIE family protein phosphatase [Armatimonadota bacterium]